MSVANLNIGILGHVDSGKTSLAKALSITASTAAFDKSPQSQSRGITLDLGFSSRLVTPSECPLLSTVYNLDCIQYTFVDCPGHASLIKTVLCGAQIIDAMILVVDATKGFQTQTGECVVIGEVLNRPLVVALNKIDLVPGDTQEEKSKNINKIKNKIKGTFRKTRWPTVEIIELSAAPRSNTADQSSEISPPINTDALLPAILDLVDVGALKERCKGEDEKEGEFFMLVDHCFPVKGQGTVLTGTVINGKVCVGNSILLPEHRLIKKVKSIQIFKKSVEKARRGDRVGICITQFDSTLMERGLICSATPSEGNSTKANSNHNPASPSCVEEVSTFIAEIYRVRFHPLPCDHTTKFHITIGHSTAMGSMRFFSRAAQSNSSQGELFNLHEESLYEEELGEDAFMAFDSVNTHSNNQAYKPGQPIPLSHQSKTGRKYFAIILLERPVFIYSGAVFVATRLDIERENICRLAICGSVVSLLDTFSPESATSDKPSASTPSWRSLPIIRYRTRELQVDRVISPTECIASGLVAPKSKPSSVPIDLPSASNRTSKGGVKNSLEAPLRTKDDLHREAQKFLGLVVYFRRLSGSDSEACNENDLKVKGRIDSTFGQGGKVKLVFERPVFKQNASSATDASLSSKKKKKSSKPDSASDIQEIDIPADTVFLYEGAIELTLKKYPLAIQSTVLQ